MSFEALYRFGITIREWFGWKVIYGLCVVGFLYLVAQFHDPTTGFSSLISIGSHLDAVAVPKLKAVPHHVYEDSWGYDGTYYVQFALSPLLDDPALDRAIDNPPYRARRILVPWLAWLLGGAEPRWIVQAYALVNVGCWLGLAWLLWGWFPPDSFNHFVRWAGLLFSAGMCMSVRHSLTDGPSLLMAAAAVRLWESRRATGAAVMMAMAILAKETSLVASICFVGPPFRSWQAWLRAAVAGALALVPIALWIAYVQSRFRVDIPAVSAFTLPLRGFAEKWGFVLGEIHGKSWFSTQVFTLLVTFALLVQFLFLITRWNPANVWWRIGAGFAFLTLFLAMPVWEGHPGAAPRVLLPMSLAFNMLVPYERRWIPVLMAGNLSLFMGIASLRTPPREFYQLAGSAPLTVECGDGWYAPESKGNRSWRWARDDGVLLLKNPLPTAVNVRLEGALTTITPRRVEIVFNDVEMWSAAIESGRAEFAPPVMRLDPGATGTVRFRTDRPPVRANITDPRSLTFAVHDLVITASVSAGSPSPGR